MGLLGLKEEGSGLGREVIDVAKFVPRGEVQAVGHPRTQPTGEANFSVVILKII
jgi:hypothetical protein